MKKEYEVPEVEEILVEPHLLYDASLDDPIIDPN